MKKAIFELLFVLFTLLFMLPVVAIGWLAGFIWNFTTFLWYAARETFKSGEKMSDYLLFQIGGENT